MTEKQIRAMLDQIEAQNFSDETSARYWMVRAQLVTALAIRELSDSLNSALPTAGMGS